MSKLKGYKKIAMKRFHADEFYEFCDRNLGHLDEVASEFFASDIVHDAIHQKVQSLYPEHEVDSFTELFWDRVQKGRDYEGGAFP